VTILLADYTALLDCRRRLAEHEARLRVFNDVSRSPIVRDLEVAAYLASRFGLAPVNLILQECCALFGVKRTPSKSAAYRYWVRLRSPTHA
jgi:hypothetical protein